jgi:hypothetical protein
MKVLLISANTETINMPVLPLGLAFVDAALLAQGFETKIINLMDAADSKKLIEETISKFRPDAIGISVRNIDTQDIKRPVFMLEPVKLMIAWCREFSKAPIIIGGPGYTAFILKQPSIIWMLTWESRVKASLLFQHFYAE